MTDDFKKYLDLRFTKKSIFEKKLLLSLHSQLKKGRILTKTVRFLSRRTTTENGKTTIIRKLLKNSKLEVLTFNDAEIDGKKFDSFESMRDYVKNHDNFVVLMGNKSIASHKELHNTSYKPIHDIIVIAKKKNSLVIFEDFDHPSSFPWLEDEFRFGELFDIKILISEKPPEAYRQKYISGAKIFKNKTVFDFLLKYSSDFNLSEFHSLLTMLKALSKTHKINEKLIKEAILFLSKRNIFDESAVLGLNAIIGREELKKTLYKIVDTYRKKHELEQMGINKVLCYLFAGPPGTGKTFAVRCLSKELDINLDHVNLMRLENEGRNTSAALHSIFENAMQQGECILFIDEAEKILGKSDIQSSDGPLQGELQQLIDGFDEFNKRFKGIIILNVNQIAQFSQSLLDRFKVICFSTPDDNDRRAYLQQKMILLEQKVRNIILNEISIEEMTRMTKGSSYRQIDRLWAEIVLMKFEEHKTKPIREVLQPIKLPPITYFG